MRRCLQEQEDETALTDKFGWPITGPGDYIIYIYSDVKTAEAGRETSGDERPSSPFLDNPPTHKMNDAASISRATSISRASKQGSTISRTQSLIKKNIAPHDLRPSDVLIERFVAWKAIVKQLIAYFEVSPGTHIILPSFLTRPWLSRASPTSRTTLRKR